MNLSLFSLNPAEAGFRLQRMELWNWGTFDDKIYSIEPGGENSLLTGANGSGKTTFVHALLTLLAAERRMRSFNMSAEGKTKNERTEESYVLGEYGLTEDESGSKAQRLREDRSKVRSVILAVFKSEDQFVTLAQIRWFAGPDLKRSFVIAHKALSVETDLRYFDTQGEWKKRLRQQNPKQGSRDMVEFFDGPKEYGTRLRSIFGMRSEKAQSLFNQTISLKILGNLDEFIRNQMLEETEMETDFEKLKDHFKTLSEAHRNIEKTLKQIELLQPVRQYWNDWKNIEADKYSIDLHRQTLPGWFATHQRNLLEKEIKQLDEALQQTRHRMQEIQTVIEEENQQLIATEVQIQSSQPGRLLAELERQVKELEGEKQKRNEATQRYNAFAEKLGWHAQVNEREFEKNRRKAEEKANELRKDLDEKRTAKVRMKDARNKGEDDIQTLDADVEQLKKQKNNITGRIAQIRQELLEYTGATEAEIPFAGELIHLREGEEKWEYAIEKLLHNFGQRLLVPEQYYKMVNKYVQNTDMRGRIVYERYKEGNYLTNLLPLEPDTVPDKLDIKHDSEYADWVEFQLRKYYNFYCTDNLNEFAKEDYAITSSGLIRNGSRHEKDDRNRGNSRQHYVLGWDNSAKLRLLISEMTKLEEKVLQLRKEEAVLRTHIENLEKQENALNELLRFTGFAELDWANTAAQIADKEKERLKLEKGDPTLKELQQKKDALQQRIRELNGKKEERIREEEKQSSQLQQWRNAITRCEETLQAYIGESMEEKFASFQREYINKVEYTIDLDVIDKVRNQVSDLIRKKFDELNSKAESSKRHLNTAINRFKYPTDEKLLQQFPDWRGDTHRLPESVELAGEYMDMLERLEGEELVEQRERFKKYLNEEMINRMSSFGGRLNEHLQQIQRRVDELNKSLAGIRYRQNPATYIQLEGREELSPNIKDFRHRLVAWKPNLAEYHRSKDDSILEASYVKIKELIDDLESKENWRREVMDVRQWLRFVAREVREEDKTTYRSYTGTEKLSGGEQAQLTYTILGSAIAYQFGITSDGLSRRSFRFICVDEAFSRQDEEKARYLMNLCKQLNLQIMVVSPDKTEEFRIVEPFVARIHYVQRRANRDSIMYDMPIKQLKETLEKRKAS
ncbi:MAG TPA: SbcC/MukB-like Walker B domain-containing protein [Phnomibacter sp.]|nr:SbcC/MukB-like Walker B domain-containing protein [Phnomibacter sp.]